MKDNMSFGERKMNVHTAKEGPVVLAKRLHIELHACFAIQKGSYFLRNISLLKEQKDVGA